MYLRDDQSKQASPELSEDVPKKGEGQGVHTMQIMGIINVTPDSFYSVSRNSTLQQAYEKAQILREEGADWFDIGGESTRPGANPVSIKEELQRIIPVVRACIEEGIVNISVDTYKADVARAAIQAGARMINDISGCSDPEMRKVIAESSVDVVLMHMQGTPQTMQMSPEYPEGVVETVFKWFQERIELCMLSGIALERIILDPGIGFGKKLAHNLALLEALPVFRTLKTRLLVGISRKSFLGTLTGRPVEKRLTETIAMQTLLMTHADIYQSIDYIRVHDVAEHVALRTLFMRLAEVGSTLLSLSSREVAL